MRGEVLALTAAFAASTATAEAATQEHQPVVGAEAAIATIHPGTFEGGLGDQGPLDGAMTLSASPNGKGGFDFARSATAGQTPAELPPTVTATFKTDTKNVKVSVSDMATQKVTVLQNFRAKGTPTRIVRKAEAQGKCRVIDGREEELYTAGHDTNSMTRYGRDLRKSEICKIGGKLIRVACGNPVIKKPNYQTIPGKVLFVKNRAKVNVKLHAEADATANCVVDGASASAKGHGVADASVKLNTLISTLKGGADSISVKLYEQAAGNASAKATAEAHCDTTTETKTTVTPPTTPPEIVKEIPPTVQISNLNHLGTNMVGAVCEIEAAAPGKTIAQRVFNILKGGGNFVSNIYLGNDPNEFCQDYRAPSYPSDPSDPNSGTVIRAQVTDNKGATKYSDSNPIKIEELPQ